MKTMLSRQRELTEILEVFPLALQNLRLAAAGERIPVRVAFSVLLPFGERSASSASPCRWGSAA